MHPLVILLTGGDRRSIGRSAEVVAIVLDDPALFPVVFNGMLIADPLIRMRAVDAVENFMRQRPDLLVSTPHVSSTKSPQSHRRKSAGMWRS